MVGPVVAIIILAVFIWWLDRRRETPSRVLTLQDQQAMFANYVEQSAGSKKWAEPSVPRELQGQPIIHELDSRP